jgi:putative peptidoglycan lipid II flippase
MLAAPWIVRLMTPGFSASKLDLTITLVRLMLPYMLAAGMLALFMGALNVYGSFAAPALAPALLNIAIIVSLVMIAPLLERPVIAPALGVLIGGAVQVIWQLPFLRRYRLHPWRAAQSRHPSLKRMARRMVPAALGGAVYQINILVGMMLASLLTEGSISYLYYADRLVEFPLGVAALAASTAILPSMARDAAAGDPRALRANFEYGFRLVSYFSLPAAAGLILLGEPIVTLLFARGEFSGTDVRLTVRALSYYAVGLWAFSAVRIVVAAFFAMQDSRTPVRAAVFSILANLLLGWILMQPLAHGGMALATSLASALNLLLLLAALDKKLGGLDRRGLAASLSKSLLSTAVMAVALGGLSRVMLQGPGQTAAGLLLGLTLSIAAGVSIYLAVSLAFGSPEARGLWGALRGGIRVR